MSLKSQWFLDCFCGSGLVGARLVHSHQHVYFLDKVLGPQGDLCARRIQLQIGRDARMRRVAGSMQAPPCSSLSRIQQISALGPLRTSEFPLGVPDLSEERQARVQIGNKCAAACAFLCRIFLKCGIPFIVENPGLSFLWLLPEFQKLLAHPDVVLVQADQCLFGTRWRKRTGFLCGHIDRCDLEKLQCKCASKGGRCDRTGKRHQHLIGSDGTGGSWTSRAQNYPPALAKILSSILLHAAQSKTLCMRS